ncbi:hypothetical protein ACFLT7_06400 [candidate division KSB1 bacterium]
MRRISILFIFTLGLGCAHDGFPIWDLFKDSAHVYLTDKRFEPKPDDFQVQVLEAPPSDGRYLELAYVQIQRKTKDRFGKVTPGEVLELLQELTRQIGGDALLNIRYDPKPDGVYRLKRLSVRGMAIVLIKSQPIRRPEPTTTP